MTTTAQSIVFEVQTTLQDLDGIRWPADEIVRSLNDAQREIVSKRPETAETTVEMDLVAGAKQTTPSDCCKLIEIPRNTNGPAIRVADRALLDALDPGWYTKPGVKTIKHVTHEASRPNTFYAYPPAGAGASVDLVYAPYPTDVPVPGGVTYAQVTGDIDVDDVFKNALIHFCLFRAFSKDAEFGGNAGLAGTHYGLFKSEVGADEAPAAG
ncbi:MAG: DUF6682 family protein [Rhodoferax sp.]